MCKPDWKFRAWVLPWEENHIAERHRELLEKWFTHGSELAPVAPRHSAHTGTLAYSGEWQILHFHQRRIYAICSRRPKHRDASIPKAEEGFLSGSHCPQLQDWTLGRAKTPDWSGSSNQAKTCSTYHGERARMWQRKKAFSEENTEGACRSFCIPQ